MGSTAAAEFNSRFGAALAHRCGSSGRDKENQTSANHRAKSAPSWAKSAPSCNVSGRVLLQRELTMDPCAPPAEGSTPAPHPSAKVSPSQSRHPSACAPDSDLSHAGWTHGHPGQRRTPWSPPIWTTQPSPVTPRPFWTICTDAEFYWKRYPIMTYRL